MWRWRRWLLQSVLGAWSSAFFAFAIWYGWGIFSPELIEDPATRALTGVVLSASVWILGLLVRVMAANSKNAIFVNLAPFSMGRYVVTNLKLRWPAVVVTLLALPALLLIFVTKRNSGTFFDSMDWGLRGSFTSLLLFYVCVLAPFAELVPGRHRALYWLFVPRRIFERWPAYAWIALFCVVILNWWTKGAVVDLSQHGCEILLGMGDLGYGVIAILSPFSALAVLDRASLGAVLSLDLVLMLTLALELRAVRDILSWNQSRWEASTFEDWLDSRENFMDVHEKSLDKVQSIESRRLARVFTHESDSIGQPTARESLTYRDDRSPESQVARHDNASIQRRMPGARMRDSTGSDILFHRSPWLAILALIWVAWIASTQFMKGAYLFGASGMALAIAQTYLSGNWWTRELNLSVVVPVRVSRMVLKSITHRWYADALLDVGASSLLVIAWNQPVWTVLPWIVALQILRVSGNFGTWITILDSSTFSWKSMSWLIVHMFVWGSFGVPVLTGYDPFGSSEVGFAFAIWIPALVSLASVIVGIAAVAWWHRKTDMSLPKRRTSYTHPVPN